MTNTYLTSIAANNNLYSVDYITGTLDLIGSTDLVIHSLTSYCNILYGITSGSSLVRISTRTGSATEIGSLGIDNTAFNGIAISPTTGGFYAIGNTNGETSGLIASVNPLTGAATKIGNLGNQLTPSGDISFDKNGNLYGSLNVRNSASDVFAKINLETGNATIIGSINEQNVYSLLITPSLILGGAADGSIVNINSVTGVGVAISSTGVVITGLAQICDCTS